MSLDLTAFQPVLKQLYGPEQIRIMAYKDNPLFAMVPKDENFVGDVKKIPINYGTPQGRSATFSDALANMTSSKYKAFLLTRVQDYSIASVDSETMLASANDKGAFLEALTSEMDRSMDSLTRSIAVALYRKSSGSIGQCNASVSSTSLVLKNSNDVTNFEIGMELVFSTADGGGSVKSGSVTVTGADRDTGTLTVDALTAIDGGTGVAANDYIFVEGDYDEKLSGLLSWIPSSAPSSSSFFGVDRTADVTRLGGIRYDGSSLPIEEALIKAAVRAAREGAKPDVCFLNYSKYQDLQVALGSKVQYIDVNVIAGVAFRGIVINGPRGPIKVIPDQNCPSDRAFMLQMDTWKLHSLGGAPRIIDMDGLKTLRSASEDSLQFRMAFYGNLACYAPGYNVNINLGT